jgi:tryptophan synthase alpha chain
VGPEWLYVALRSGITGTYTDLGPSQEAFLDGLRDRGAQVMAGFGIQDAAQVRAVTDRADAAVIGSALVRTVAAADSGDFEGAVRRKLESLRGDEIVGE